MNAATFMVILVKILCCICFLIRFGGSGSKMKSAGRSVRESRAIVIIPMLIERPNWRTGVREVNRRLENPMTVVREAIKIVFFICRSVSAILFLFCPICKEAFL